MSPCSSISILNYYLLVLNFSNSSKDKFLINSGTSSPSLPTKKFLNSPSSSSSENRDSSF